MDTNPKTLQELAAAGAERVSRAVADEARLAKVSKDQAANASVKVKAENEDLWHRILAAANDTVPLAFHVHQITTQPTPVVYEVVYRLAVPPAGPNPQFKVRLDSDFQVASIEATDKTGRHLRTTDFELLAWWLTSVERPSPLPAALFGK